MAVDTTCSFTVTVFIITLTCIPTSALQWNGLPNDSILEVCEGGTIDFYWSVRLDPGDWVEGHTIDRQLKYNHGTDTEKINPRFTHGPGYNFQINRTIVDDTGNYTITVRFLTVGSTASQTRTSTAFLLVKESPAIFGNSLKASLQPQAVKVDDAWRDMLSCGTFRNRGHPAVTVVWTTPSGTVLPSTSYDNGVFYLVLSSPVEYGPYDCQIDLKAPALECTNDNSTMLNSVMTYIDRGSVGGILLEAELLERFKRSDADGNCSVNAELVTQNAQLMSRVFEMETTVKSVTLVMTRTCRVARIFYPESGIQTITVSSGNHMQVYCDQDTDGGGWLVIQRRVDGQENFRRGWNDYLRGFGNVRHEFWLGLEKIYQLTTNGKYMLRVDMISYWGRRAYATYQDFWLDGSWLNYTLHVSGYNGTAGDSLIPHNNMQFSTPDLDNDNSPEINCAAVSHAAWWYHNCWDSSLNGWYFTGEAKGVQGILWYSLDYSRSLSKAEMKIRLVE